MKILVMQLVLLQRSETEVTRSDMLSPTSKKQMLHLQKKTKADSHVISFSKSRIGFLYFSKFTCDPLCGRQILFSNPWIPKVLKSVKFPYKRRGCLLLEIG